MYGHAPQNYSPWQNAILPAEELMKIKEGDDFGWPYTYYDPFKNKRMLAPEYGGNGIIEGRKLPYENAVPFADPLMGLPAHWAPNDLMFYKGNQFPERYKKGVFIAFHGSTNRSPYPQAGYIIAFVPFENGKPNGKWEVFADGFAGVDTIKNMTDAKFRPMGLAEGPDGSLYISESKQGKIWRVIFHGDKTTFGASQLATIELRKSRSYIKIPDEQADNLSLRQPIDGKAIYTTHCAACHQVTGEGVDNLYPPLVGSEWVNGKKEKLISVILFGLQGEIQVKSKTYNQIMPSYAFLNDDELTHLINYLRNNFGNKVGAVNRQDISTVRNSKP